MESFLKCETYHSSFCRRIFARNELSPECEVRGQSLPCLLKIFSNGQCGAIGALSVTLHDLSCKMIGPLHIHGLDLLGKFRLR